MIVQTKKLIPEIYSQSYDMSIFTGLLDLVYTARQLDVLRIKNAHSPQSCFEEDVPSLASLFGLGRISNRDLIENYRLLVKQKGTRDVVLALAQFAAGLEAIQDKAKIRIIRQDFYSDEESIETIKSVSFFTEQRALLEQASETIDGILDLATKEEKSIDNSSSVTIKQETTDKIYRSGTNEWSIKTGYTLSEGKLSFLTEQRTGAAKTFNSNTIARTHISAEVYLPLATMNYELLDLLIHRLVPIDVTVTVRDIIEADF